MGKRIIVACTKSLTNLYTMLNGGTIININLQKHVHANVESNPTF